MTGPTETLTLKEACVMAGRNERTLRRWIADGTLTNLRPDGPSNAPCRVRRSELLAHLATLPEPLPAPCQRPDLPGGAPGDDRTLALALSTIEDLRADKARALADLDACRLELTRARREVAQLTLDVAEERLARTLTEACAALPGPPRRGLLARVLGR